MSWDESKGVYHWPCPCGDRFEISRVRKKLQRQNAYAVNADRFLQPQLADGFDVATCPSCSLIIRVVFDQVGLRTPCMKSEELISGSWQMDFEQYAETPAASEKVVSTTPVAVSAAA